MCVVFRVGSRVWETLKNAQMSFPKVGGKLSHARARSYSLMTFLKLFSAYRVFLFSRVRSDYRNRMEESSSFLFSLKKKGAMQNFRAMLQDGVCEREREVEINNNIPREV